MLDERRMPFTGVIQMNRMEIKMSDKNSYIVGGYCFGSAEDAEIAKQEEKKIEYLEQHMDYEQPENMLLIYKKAIENRVFQTPIGWEYMRTLQQKLLAHGKTEEDIPPIAVYTVFAHRKGDEIRVPHPESLKKRRAI